MLGALAWQVAYLNKKILFLFWGEVARGCPGSLLWCAPVSVCVCVCISIGCLALLKSSLQFE
ncbi:hypothetical protein HanRHA438_Chr11g0484431 [Helianthus annuus]|nr:hypothetical protein HanIR_Chr11g0507331 [Helianthus annuus]KAJ0516019.1 hypothetical protein HanHA89_Chr11g0409171 [Helianthus annuus]KAJ0869008.1 hypothetical protein HanRHA438_Chr11g0484431 [Helianthus annuus]